MPNGSFEQSWTAYRVVRELPDMEAMTRRLASQLADAESGKIKLPRVPRWDGKQRPRIAGPSFIRQRSANLFCRLRTLQTGPQRHRKVPILRHQHRAARRVGPSGVWPKSEEQIDAAGVDRLIDELDRAAKAGVAVDFLLSPHYVPDWLFAKYPHLAKPVPISFPIRFTRRKGGRW